MFAAIVEAKDIVIGADCIFLDFHRAGNQRHIRLQRNRRIVQRVQIALPSFRRKVKVPLLLRLQQELHDGVVAVFGSAAAKQRVKMSGALRFGEFCMSLPHSRHRARIGPAAATVRRRKTGKNNHIKHNQNQNKNKSNQNKNTSNQNKNTIKSNQTKSKQKHNQINQSINHQINQPINHQINQSIKSTTIHKTNLKIFGPGLYSRTVPVTAMTNGSPRSTNWTNHNALPRRSPNKRNLLICPNRPPPSIKPPNFASFISRLYEYSDFSEKNASIPRME